jgi:hypothetical protein
MEQVFRVKAIAEVAVALAALQWAAAVVVVQVL